MYMEEIIIVEDEYEKEITTAEIVDVLTEIVFGK